MRLIVASSGIFISAVSAFGQVSALSPEDQKAYRDVVLTFVLADECSKRHQNPQIFEKATELFQQTAVHYKLPDAETEVAQAAAALKAKPLENQDGFTLATLEACRKLEADITQKISR